MKEIKLPILGSISLSESDWEYKYEYTKEITIQNIEIDFSIHFKNVADNLEKVVATMEKMETILEIGKQAYLKDFKNKGEADYYINEWKNEIFNQIFSSEEFDNFISDTDSDLPIEQRLLNKLRIVSISIYADSNHSFITMDYAFGKEYDNGFRDDMLIVRLNPNLEVTEVNTEG